MLNETKFKQRWELLIYSRNASFYARLPTRYSGRPRNERFAWIHTGHKDVYVLRMTKMDQDYISFYIFYSETNWNCKGLPRPRDKEINFSKLQSVLFSLHQVEVLLKIN